jgi:hypothetical protein
MVKAAGLPAVGKREVLIQRLSAYQAAKAAAAATACWCKPYKSGMTYDAMQASSNCCNR